MNSPAQGKRKVTDPKLEIITIDSVFGLTLIVGAPDQPKGQKAFRVSKGSFRNTSAVWAKDFKEKGAKINELEYREDSSDALHIVLLIAHFQMSGLPESLSMKTLFDLAILTDNYSLGEVVGIGLERKKWMEPHREVYKLWPANTHLLDFAVATHAFNLQNDFKYPSTRLAVEAAVGDAGKCFYTDDKERKIFLQSSLPDYVSSKHNILRHTFHVLICIKVEIKRIRSDILMALIACCAAGLDDAIFEKAPLCGNPLCKATKIGVIVQGLRATDLYPNHSSTVFMCRNILSYWKSIKSIGELCKDYDNHPGGPGCTYAACFGDFGIKMAAKAILELHTHEDVWEQWKLVRTHGLTVRSFAYN
jgi:hypothetical protein